VSGFYDSLVAKLIAWGRDFEEARIRTRNALAEFTIEGINTTIPLHKTIVQDPNFIKGDLSTDYLDRFNLMDKMHQNAKNRTQKLSSAALAAALLQSEYIKIGSSNSTEINNTNATSTTTATTRSWNRSHNGRRFINAI
jgi:acetyl-CoA/propionyl-CoA carboxylase